MVECGLCGKGVERVVGTALVEDVVRAYAEALRVDVTADFAGAADPELKLLECQACGLRQYTPAVAGSGAFYDALQKHGWYYASERPEYGEALRLVGPGDRLLEIGCGRGVFGQRVRSRSYLGIELSDDARRAAAASGLAVVGDRLEDYAAAHPGEHDVVASFQVLEHVPAPRRFLEDAVHCLRPGGLLVLSVPNEDSYLRFAQNQLLNMPPHHQTRWSRRAVESIGSLLGLRLLGLWQQPAEEELLSDLSAAAVEASLRGWREPERLVDLSALGRRRRKAAGSVGKRLLLPFFRRAWLRPPGSSTTAAFVKPG